MKIRTGIDIVYVPDFKKRLNDPGFVKRIFLHSELMDTDPSHLAGIFALKEAFFKASQINIDQWNEIEVFHKDGKPFIESDNLKTIKGIKSIDCSISHDKDYAISNVMLLIE